MKKILYVIFLILIISCSNQETNQPEKQPVSEQPELSESITFSKEQIDLAGIKIKHGYELSATVFYYVLFYNPQVFP